MLPTYNGAATLGAVLDRVAEQKVTFPFETIAIDSGSTDGTVALLERRVDRLLRIPAARFDHGLTRNAGLEAARGEAVVLLVQDAVPACATWLEALAAPLFADPTIAGTWARQQPRPEASALTRHALAGYAGTGAQARVSRLASRAALAAMAPLDRLALCAFDNVCSCVRRSVWERHPFPAADIAEDLEWARTVLLAGHALAYVPAATVIHSHERSARYELERTYLVHRRLYALFGVSTVPRARDLARAVAASLALHARLAPPGERARALALAVAWPLGQYLGARAERRGWRRWRSGRV